MRHLPKSTVIFMSLLTTIGEFTERTERRALCCPEAAGHGSIRCPAEPTSSSWRFTTSRW